MSNISPTVDRYLQSVPVGKPTIDLATALKLFQSERSEVMVIVDREGKPLGIVRCRSLISYIAKHLLLRSRQPSDSQLMLKRLQSFLTRTKIKASIEPVTVLPASTNVSELWFLWQTRQNETDDDSPYALVDKSGKYLGLLDRWRLLQSQFKRETRQIPLESERLFFQFLEQLPIPVVAYAANGRILHQNRNWREQIGDFCPVDEGSCCPLVLESRVEAKANVPAFVSEAIAQSASLEENSHSIAARLSCRQALEVAPEAKEISFLEPPTTVRDRAWQFIKFPLHLEEFDSADVSQVPIWLVVATDVTEHQLLCKELSAKNADLVQLNRLKDEFLACISHELKSPLTAVLGLSSLLKEQKLGELNQRQVHYAQLIYQSGRQLMELVNDLLDLTRLETGQLKLNPAPVRIKEVCENAYAAIEEQYKKKTNDKISFRLAIEPGLETIIADELRLRQILVHLIDNAVKFTPTGKPIGLNVNRWEDWIAFTIWDRGIGIPEEHQHLIFQKFQQLESPLTRQFEGTGLGLFLVQRLAKAHGGDISFISKIGSGSQFTLLLPPSPTPQKSERVESKQKRHPLVLVVEANPRAIDNLTEKAIALGCRVAIARTGTEALEKARQLKPQTIFLNPALPLLSGWDVLTLLRSDKKTKHIRVILTVTQSDLPRTRQMTDCFLCLPVKQEALQEILGNSERESTPTIKRLTILRLYPDLKRLSWGDNSGMDSPIDLALITQLSQLNHRILEADDLEQAEMLARVWKIDAVILDGTVTADPIDYLRSLSHCEQLSTLPLVILNAQLAQAANQFSNLSVFPCLLPADSQNCDRLLQAIAIAVE